MAKKKNNVIKLNTGRKGIRVTSENRVMVVAITIAALVGALLAFMPNAYRISINGEFIGAIKSKKVIEGAKDTVIAQLSEQYKAEVEFEDELEIERYRAKRKDYIDQTYLISCMRSKMDILIGFKELYIDGEPIGIIASESDVDVLKEELSKKYYGNKPVKVNFGKKVEVKDIFAKEEDLISMDKLVQKCTSTTPKSITYTVQAGDTLSGIAAKFNTTIDGIVSANAGFSDKTMLRLGQEIKANINEPLLPLQLVVPADKPNASDESDKIEGQDKDKL